MQPLEKGGTVQFFHLKTSPVGCLMFLIWPRDNYSRDKSPHSNSNYFALLAWVLHVCFANLFKLSRNSQPRQCDSSSGVVFSFALYTGEERKKKNAIKYGRWWERTYLFVWYHLPVLPHSSTESLEQRLTGLNCSLSKPGPAALPRVGPQHGWVLHLPLPLISPQTENSPVALVCGCLYTRLMISPIPEKTGLI